MRERKIKFKVCGMRETENMQEISRFKPEFFGLIFYPQSPRYVSVDKAKELPLFANIERIGVFVGESLENVLTIAETSKLSLVQLHGQESPKFCERLKERNLKVIKAFAVDEDFDGAILKDYQDACDFFLFDTKTKAHGGSGQNFDWSVLQIIEINKPFFLGGGIGAENAADAIAACAGLPLYALDINSRAEIAPGVKSLQKIEQIKQTINQFRK